MLNPNIEIKKWFYTNLTSSSTLPVYDGYAPDNGVNEYVIMTGRASAQEQGKISYADCEKSSVYRKKFFPTVDPTDTYSGM